MMDWSSDGFSSVLGPFASGVEHLRVKPLLALTLGQGGQNQKLEFGTKQANAVSARNMQSRHIVTKARIHHQFDPLTVQRDGRQIAHGRKGGATLLAISKYGGKSLIHRQIGRAHVCTPVINAKLV